MLPRSVVIVYFLQVTGSSNFSTIRSNACVYAGRYCCHCYAGVVV